METFFATCAPGLESLLAGELTALGLLKPRLLAGAAEGGVAFEGGPKELALACRRLTVAERVLVDHKDGKVPWGRYGIPGGPLAVRAKVKGSRETEKSLAARLAREAGAKLAAFDDDAPIPLVYARLEGPSLTVSVDASGAPLSRRGWRLQTAKAPLRETLAAALPLSAGWDGATPLVDPFCGSGTIAIEAALRAAGRSPHVPGRRFAFQAWRGFDVPAAISEHRSTPPIVASDRDAGAIAAAKANAERAGVADRVDFSVKAVSAFEAPKGPGVLATNPPYGERVSAGKDLRDLYASFGNMARAQCVDWEVAFLAPPGPLPNFTGLGLKPTFSTLNGGLSVRIWRGRV